MPDVIECMQKREARHRDSRTDRRLCGKGRLNGSAMTQIDMVVTTQAVYRPRQGYTPEWRSGGAGPHAVACEVLLHRLCLQVTSNTS